MHLLNKKQLSHREAQRMILHLTFNNHIAAEQLSLLVQNTHRLTDLSILAEGLLSSLWEGTMKKENI